MAKNTGRTTYSEKIKGARGNYGWDVRFDLTENEYLGITQFEGEVVKDRVVLSPAQVRELVEFVSGKKAVLKPKAA